MSLFGKVKEFCLEYFVGVNAGKFYNDERRRAEYDLWDQPVEAKRKKNLTTLAEIVDRGVSKGIPNMVLVGSIIYGGDSGNWSYALGFITGGEVFRNVTSYLSSKIRSKRVGENKIILEEQLREENYAGEDKKSGYDGWLSPEDRYNDP